MAVSVDFPVSIKLLLRASAMLFLLGVSCKTSSSQELNIKDESRLSSFVTHCSNPANLQSRSLTNPGGRLKSSSSLQRVGYSDLKSYYRRSLRAFAGNYPSDIFHFAAGTSLQSFRGTLHIEVPEVHRVPFMPIAPLAYDQESMEFALLSIQYEGMTVYGLQISAKVSPMYKNLPSGDKLDELYLPDVNAREMGFTHAQLIPQLSRNVRPAPVFQYNGFQSWAAHQRYGQNDQLSRPILLTNFAHQAGERYAISAHPDFALELPNAISQGAELMFFLWRADGRDNSLPDFLFRFVYR